MMQRNVVLSFMKIILSKPMLLFLAPKRRTHTHIHTYTRLITQPISYFPCLYASSPSGLTPPCASQLSSSLPTSLKLTGLVMKRSTPLVKASLWSLLEARPVRAMMRAGEEGFLLLWLRASSMSRMARVASKPFITGIEISFHKKRLVLGLSCAERTIRL